MRIEMNVKLEFDLNDATLDVLEARISAKEVTSLIADGKFESYRDGTNEPAGHYLPHPMAVFSPIESFLWRNQQIFERG